MQISLGKISFVKPVKVQKNVRFCGGLTCDSFEKKENNLFNVKNLREIFFNPENEIGHGAKNTVYSIPNNDEYVLRVSKGFFNPDITKAEYVDCDRPNRWKDYNRWRILRFKPNN